MIITQRGVDMLKASTWKEYIELTVMERKTVGQRPHCKLDLVSLYDPSCRLDNEVLTVVNDIPVPEDLFPSQRILSQYPHLSGVELFEPSDKIVDLVIGVGAIQTWFPPMSVKRGLPRDPMLAETGWGWALLGGLKDGNSVAGFLIRADNDSLSRKLERQWSLEEVPLLAQETSKMTIEEKRAYDFMLRSTKFEDGRYSVAVPWKKPKSEVNREMDAINSKETAMRRLHSLGKKMS